MKLRTILYGSVAAAVLAAASPVFSPIDINPVAPVQAAASISFSIFYDDLAPHGDWVSYQGGYVFVPANTGPDWRPYTVGRWVYTDDYGWMWVSDEPHGWATYHYGRWAFADDIGWYWVPGTRWAPAWVSWRRSDDHIVWAPLPPDGDDPDLAINISIGAIPEDYWVAVPTQSFLNINLSVVIIDDDDDRRRIVREARDEDRVRARNERMVNIAFDPEFIEERTGEKVPRREVRRSERPGREKVGDESVTVFNEEIQPDRERKPGKVKKVEEVRRGGTGDEPAVGVKTPEDGVAESPPQSPDATTASRRKKPQQANQDDEQVIEEKTPEEGVAEGPPDNPDPAKADRRKKPPQQAEQGDEPPEGEPVEKQRRKKPILAEDGDGAGAEETIGANNRPRRAKPAEQAAEQPEEEGAPPKAVPRQRQTAEQPAQRGKAKACDPSVNPDCPVQ